MVEQSRNNLHHPTTVYSSLPHSLPYSTRPTVLPPDPPPTILPTHPSFPFLFFPRNSTKEALSLGIYIHSIRPRKDHCHRKTCCSLWPARYCGRRIPQAIRSLTTLSKSRRTVWLNLNRDSIIDYFLTTVKKRRSHFTFDHIKSFNVIMPYLEAASSARYV